MGIAKTSLWNFSGPNIGKCMMFYRCTFLTTVKKQGLLVCKQRSKKFWNHWPSGTMEVELLIISLWASPLVVQTPNWLFNSSVRISPFIAHCQHTVDVAGAICSWPTDTHTHIANWKTCQLERGMCFYCFLAHFGLASNIKYIFCFGNV